jgi:hypothetical protein
MNTVKAYEQPLSKLLAIARKNNIQVHSHICKCIVQADLEDHFRPTPRIVFTDDPLSYQLMAEAGLNYESYISFDTNNQFNEEYMEGVKELLQQHGIATSYLDGIALLAALSAVYLEADEPLPRKYWYHTLTLNTLFQMNDANLRHFTGLIDDTADDYLRYSDEYVSGLQVLYFQTEHNLYKFADSIAKNAYLRTKRGVIAYLYSIISLTEQKVLTYFGNINKNVYPNRAKLVISAYRTNARKVKEVFHMSSNTLLAIPPAHFEERFMTAVANDEVINEVFPEFNYLTPIDFPSISSYATLACDTTLQLTSREQLVGIHLSKSIRTVPHSVMYRLTGWARVIPYVYCYKYITLKPTFNVVSNVHLCPNHRDIYLEPITDFAITYGNFLDFRCYTPEELTSAFQVSGTYVSFVNPLVPNVEFHLADIEQLLDTLMSIDSRYLPNYRARVTPLKNKINLGLRLSASINLTNIRHQLTQLSSSDQQHLIAIFRNMFSAGMYQRTWQGEGYPYPMTYEETKGFCTNDIEMRMTVPLNNIADEVLLLSPQGHQVYSSLSAINYIDGDFVRITMPVTRLIDDIHSAEMCIGFGSSLLVYTGYFYLQALGYTIDDFNITLFHPESTHR